jgi:hypothetical protein
MGEYGMDDVLVGSGQKGPVMPNGSFQGIMAGLLRLQQRIAAADRVIAAAREVSRSRQDVDGTTYEGLIEPVETLDEELARFDDELGRIRGRYPPEVFKRVQRT